MKRVSILIVLIMLLSLSLCYSQEDNSAELDYNIADNDRYIVDEITIVSPVRFGTGMPEHGVTRTRLATEEEYIFKTYIIDKLLKSNRILY